MTTFRNYAFTTNDANEVQRWTVALENYIIYAPHNTVVDETVIDHILSVDEHNELTKATGLEVLKAFFNKK